MSKKGESIYTEMITECNFFEDGTLASTKTEVTPEYVTSLKDAGLSPEQIVEALKPSENITDSHQISSLQKPASNFDSITLSE